MRDSNYRKKKITIDHKMKKTLVMSLLAVIAVGIIAFFVYFHVDTVEVMGSSYYTEDEIKEMVLKGPLAKNAILAPMLYSKHDTDDISFVEGIDVSQVNNHTICISIEEVQPVGCIKYLDCYMYFDRTGIITASSVERNMRVPFFEGMEVEDVAYGDEIPFADESLLNTSVSLARIFAKNADIPDHISFDETGNITLIYGTVTALLGPDKYLEDKMTRLIAILPKVSGKTGTLHLENVTEDKKMITFEDALATTGDSTTQENGDETTSEDGEGSDSSDSSYDSGSTSDSSYDSSEQSTSDSSYDSDTSDSSYDSSSYDSSQE